MTNEIITKKHKETMLTKIIDKLSIPYYRIGNIKNNIRHRLFIKHFIVKTELNRYHWHDTDERMLYANMQLLVEYIEKERPFEIVEWGHDDESKNVKNTMIKVYTWWINYPQRKKEIDKLLTDWYNARLADGPNIIENTTEDFITVLNAPSSAKSDKLFKELHDAEDNLAKEEQEMLIDLIKIRKFLWT